MQRIGYTDILDKQPESVTSMMQKQSKTKKEMAQISHKLFQNIRTGAYVRWRTWLDKCVDFAGGDQMTSQELKDLRKAGMPDFTVNRITLSVETLTYFLTANNPRFRAVGVGEEDVDTAEAASAIEDHCFRISSFKSVFGLAMKDALVKSVGYIGLDYDQNSSQGQGDILFVRYDPRNVYPDPSSTDFLLRDASYILIRTDHTKDALKSKLPAYANKIDKASGDDDHLYTQSEADDSDSNLVQRHSTFNILDKKGMSVDMIGYYERYEKVPIQYRNVFVRRTPTEDEIKVIRERVEKRLSMVAEEQQRQLKSSSIELADKLKSGEISEERARFEMESMQIQLKKQLEQYQQQMLNEEFRKVSGLTNKVMTEEEYKELKKSVRTKKAKRFSRSIEKVIPFMRDMIHLVVSVGNDTYLYDMWLPGNDFPIVPIPYNHCGTPYPMSAVQPVIGKQREVNKAHQMLIHNIVLGTHLRWKIELGSINMSEEEWQEKSNIPGAALFFNPGTTSPEYLLPAPPPQSFLGLVERGEQEIEEMLGVTPMSQGIMRDGQSMPYRGMLALDEFNTRRIRSWMSNVVEPALEHLGNLFHQWVRVFYTTHRIFRFIDSQTGGVTEYEVNTNQYDLSGSLAGKVNDLSTLQYDVRIIPGSTLPTNRHLEMEERMEAYKAGIVDDIAVLEVMDIKGKEDIIKRKSSLAQMQKAIEEYRENLKDAEGTIETLERMIVQSKIREKYQSEVTKIESAVADHKARLKESRTKFEGDLNEMKQEIRKRMEASAPSA